MTGQHLSAALKVAANQNIRDRDYWLKKLTGNIEKSYFPYDKEPTGQTGQAGPTFANVSFGFPGKITAKLLELTRGSDYALHIYLAAGVVLLLHHYTGMEDILVATPIYKQGIQRELINRLILLRIRLRDNMTVKELLMDVKQAITEAVEHQNYPLAMLPEQLNLANDKQYYGFPLFDTAILLENLHDKEYLAQIHHNMRFSFSWNDSTLTGNIEYNSQLYEKTTTEKISGHLIELMEQALENLDSCITRLKVLPDEEKERNIQWLGKKKQGEVLTPPRGPYQEKLAEIWSEILNVEKERIGIDTNFFKLGGHSLKASRLVMRIHQEFNIKIPLTTVFAAPFIRALAREIAAAKEKTLTGAVETGKYAGLETVEKKEYYALSSAQSRIYILEHQGDLGTTYNMFNAVKLKGPLQVEALEKAFRHLVHRHESLRTSFHWINGEPVQRVTREPVFKVKHYDISQKENQKNQNPLEPVLKDFLKPFDLDRTPLLRAALVKLQHRENEHILLLDMHHIISDGTSMGILVQEFARLYIDKELQPLRTQFKDFIQWEYRFVETPAFKQQEKFWQENLSGELPRLTMPIDFKRPEKQTFAGSVIYFTLSPRLIEQLNTLARENDVTLNILLLSIYFLLLHKYTNQEDIIVGSVVSGRNHPDLEHMIGMFTNFLPIRNRVEPGHSFTGFLAAARERITSTYGNQDYPLEKIIDLLQVPIDLSRNPIFDTMLVFHNQVESSSHLDIPGLDSSACHLGRITSKLDFKLDIFPGADADGSLRFSLEYNISLFKKQTMQRFTRHFKRLIRQVAAHPGRKISEIAIFSAEEKQDLSRKRKLNTLKPVTQKKAVKPVQLPVSATFTSEPLEEYILWWGKQFGLDIRISFAPYNQVFQQLLGENSRLSENVGADGADTRGIDLLLIRFEDWIRDLDLEDESKCAKLEKNYRELERIIRHKEISSPYLVGLFPASTHLSFSAPLVSYLEDLRRRWKKLVEETANFYLLDFTNLGQRYQIGAVFDPVMDKEGHLPFTHEFYAAMGTQTARTICALVNSPFKVIVLDCDNTLWQGICGEDGPLGVKVTSPYLELQRLMLQKHDQGMLLTLCSKNNPSDVWEVFEKNPGMLLTRDHFVDWKIDWQPKSKNLKELAAQLNLGLDSFIFIDDSSVECTEMMTNCPDVLVLRLPVDPGHIPFFLEHVWALDKMVVTTEDKERTRMYRADKIRKEIREQAPSLTEFLSQLELKVSFNIMNSTQVERVSQLIQRTNQFNLSSRRRREDEIMALAETPGTCCWVVEVSDRFGDYGLVGIVVTMERSDHLFIDTFLLSCRVLGRGVEDAILTCLKKYLQECGLTGIKADYYPTPKNSPALEFLRRTWKLEDQTENYTTYSLKEEVISAAPAYAAIYYRTTLPKPAQPHRERDNHREISSDHIPAAVVDREPGDEKPGESLPGPVIDLEVYGQGREDWQHRPHLLPLQYCTAGKLLQLPIYQMEKIPFSMGEDEEPQNEIQRKLALVWQDILKQEKIGIDMSFFAAGGNSLKALLMVSKIAKELNTALTLKDVFNHPTIKKLARYIRGHAEKAGFYSIDPVEKKEYHALSSAQKRLYFLQQMDKNSTAYNISSSMILEGRLDKDKLERTIRGLIRGHESLRTSIEMIKEEPVQRIHEGVEFQVENYELQNTNYKQITNKSVGVIHSEKSPLDTKGLNTDVDQDPKSQELRARSYIQSFLRPFDLTRAPLLRVGLINLLHTPSPPRSHPSQEGKKNKYLFLVSLHHIISDAVSIQVLVQDFSILYTGKELPAIKLQYKDYSQWQNRQRASREIMEQEEYWKKEYEGEIPVLELPTDYARPAVRDFAGNRVNFVINSETSGALNALALETGVTLYILLLALYTILLAKLSSREDIVIGSPAAGRRHADLEKIIGMFVNTLALRNYPCGEKKFTDFLDEVKERTLKSLENQGYPYEELVEKAAVTRDASRNPLFDTLFVLENTGTQKIEIPGLELGAYEYENKTSKFDLTLIVMEVEGKLHLTFEYSTRLFKPGTIQRFIAYFINIIGEVPGNRQKKISDFEIITEEEKNRILFEFNDTGREYPNDKTLHRLFEEQAARTPGNIALVGSKLQNTNYKQRGALRADVNAFGGDHLSYRELNERSGKLAGLLVEKGVQSDTVVGINVERSVEMIIGILAILKSGGAYLPIDPDYPQERIDYMLKDSSAKILITAREIAALSLENVVTPGAFLNPATGHRPPATLLAYVIYTSGSTGRPKGVLVRHRSVIRLVKNTDYIEFREWDRILQTGALSFDASTFEIWSVLLNGLGLVLLPKERIMNPKALERALHLFDISCLWMTAPLFNQMVDAGEEIFAKLRNLLVGGDILSPMHINRVRKKVPGLKIINGYGPTENTTFSATYSINREYERNIPIGRPIANSTAYIFDKNSNLQPIGVVGELVVGGDGVARGYLNNPELTAEKFDHDLWDYQDYRNEKKNYKLQNTKYKQIPNYNVQNYKPNGTHASMHPCHHASITSPLYPHSTTPPLHHSPLYHTGDLARWLPDGNIEFLGRIDNQVKIRGFRIELEEIENRLSGHPGIKEVVVLAQNENGERYLCAYFVSDREYGISELRETLLKELPDYMIPSYFVPLEKIPLTPNGKIDRRALPKPGFRVHESHTAPGNIIEKKLAALWAEILGRDQLHTSQLKMSIGIHDNFFLLGGQSLKATVMAARLHKEFDVIVPLAEVFRTPSIKELAEYIKGKSKVGYISIEPAEEKEYYELSPAQKRLYFLQKMEPGSVAYNIPVIIPLPEEIQAGASERVLRELIKRHESLRTSLYLVNDEPVQRIHKEVHFEMEYYDKKEVEVKVKVANSDIEGTRGLAPLPLEPAIRNSQPVSALITSFIRPFDLSGAPLIHAGLIKGEGNRHILIVDLHHIITDGTSQEVLKHNFISLYKGEKLPALRIQYKDFAGWQNINREGVELKQQELYWLKEFAGEIPVLNIPTDYPRPLMQSYEGNSLYFEITAEQTRALNQVAVQGGATLFMALAALVNILLSKLSGQEDIVIGVPLAGRRHADLEEIIGMFVNTLALRNYPSGEKGFMDFLGEVKEVALKGFENQEYQFEDLVEKVAIQRDTARNPLFDIMFVLQNMNAGSTAQDKNPKFDNTQPVEPDLPQVYENIIQTAKFDLTLNAVEKSRGLFFSIQYCTNLFKKETVERFIIYFKQIVSMALKEPGIRISDIEILSVEEKNRLLYEFNDTAADYTKDKTIQRLFEEQVEKTPDNIALHGCTIAWMHGEDVPGDGTRVGEECLNYRELNAKANGLARTLRENAIKPDVPAAIIIEPSQEMIIGMLGVLKAGGAFLPIDHKIPTHRIKYILEESEARCLLTREELLRGMCTGSEIIPLDQAGIYSEDLGNPEPVNGPHDAAYIIYTSGSTGKPKGVVVEHGSLLNLCSWHNQYYTVTAYDRATKYAGFGFDASVWEVFPYLVIGASLHIVPEEIKLDIEKLSRYYDENKITISFLPTQMCEQFMTIESISLRVLLTGGDKLKAFIKKNYRLYNNYGPTENTVVATSYPVDEPVANIPIGKPLYNNQVYILDRTDSMQPIGIQGELCIGGDSLARGYLNRPELTAEKFCLRPGTLFKKTAPGPRKNFFLNYPGKQYAAMQPCNHATTHHSPLHHPITQHSAKFYRTGDLARWQPDGNIEFLGRMDQQVKIRGFRIELGEVESRLLKHEGIKEAVVLAREEAPDHKYLCAYVVSNKELAISELRENLSMELPDYMIPSYFVPLEKIPLTPNGKIDPKALPAPVLKGGESYAGPGNEIEKKLVEIWREILNPSLDSDIRIGIDDNFFQVGGHSLKATILTAKIHKVFDVKVPLAEIFKTPRIREIAGYIKEAVPKKYKQVELVEKREYYTLSSAQQRLYFLQQMDKEGTAYNISAAWLLEGIIDKQRLGQSIRGLIRRHESLRTSIAMIEDEPVQRIHEGVEFQVENYELQNTNYKQITNKSVGVIHSEKSPLDTKGLNTDVDQDPKSQELRAKSYIQSFIRSFDLTRAPLLRVGLVKLPHTPSAPGGRTSGTLLTPSALRSHPSPEGKSILMVDMHHIISDGMSIQVLVQDFAALYAGKELPRIKVRYKDYAEEQNRQGLSKKILEQGEYWKKEFEGEIPVLELPGDYTRPAVQGFAGNSIDFEINSETSDALKVLALETGATLYIVLLALYNIFLAKLSSREDIVIGTPTAGRRHADLENIIGMFVNTLALRNYPAGEKGFREFLGEVKETALKGFENQEYQFENLVEQIPVNRDTSRNPLFDTMFVLQNTGSQEIEIPGLKLVPYEYRNKTAKFDLALNAVEVEGKLHFTFEYSTKLFKQETVERFIVYFKNLVRGIVENKNQKISHLEILTEAEKNRLLFEFNDTATEYAKDKTIQQLFGEQVEATPDHIAVVGPAQIEYRSYRTHKTYISYRELNQRSNQLAHLLREKGVGPDTIVGIMVERSVEMIIVIMGILKSGGAYLPIDPDYPQERIDYMLKDSGATLLVTSGNLAKEGEKVRRWEGKICNIEEFLFSSYPLTFLPSYLQNSSNPATGHRPPATSLAYIIYTSGSTGRPKGVMVEHRNVIAYINAFYREFYIDERDTVLQQVSFSFDAFIEEVFPILFKGGKIAIAAKEVIIDSNALFDFLLRNDITIISVSPLLLNEIDKMPKTGSIRILISGGDVLKKEYIKNLVKTKQVYNSCGPTETTVCVTYYKCIHTEYKNVPIGKPIANYKVYILNRTGGLLPIGVPGELCIAGAGVTRGYLNRPGLTAEKFDHHLWDLQDYPDEKKNYKLQNTNKREFFKQSMRSCHHAAMPSCSCETMQSSPHRSPHYPITPLPHSPIYKTGDLAKWLPDGNILFIGRIDQQVKIRGFRIELGEIEYHLLNHKEIKEAVVLIKEVRKDEKYLCAYIVPAKPGINPVSLREYLAALLPHYMVPSHFVSLESLPLSPSGKIDRRSLLNYKDTVAGSGAEYAAPGTDMEKLIARIWKEVLGLDQVGLNDRFFDMGGNSANILRVHHKLTREIEMDLPIMLMFLHPTIYSLAGYLAGKGMEAEDKEILDNRQLDADKTMMKQSLQKLGPGLYPWFPDEGINES